MQLLCKKYGYGLTGNIATGKSTVAAILRQYGLTVIDADMLARRILEPGSQGLTAVTMAFGPDILHKSGELDRHKLGLLIFSDDSKRQMLDQITHPLIEAALDKELRQCGLLSAPKPWFYEASLLIERGRYKEFREVWLTVCSQATQLQRLMQRSLLSEADARKRMQSQLPEDLKRRQAQVIIDTDCGLPELNASVSKLLQDKFSRP